MRKFIKGEKKYVTMAVSGDLSGFTPSVATYRVLDSSKIEIENGSAIIDDGKIFFKLDSGQDDYKCKQYYSAIFRVEFTKDTTTLVKKGIVTIRVN